MNYNNYPNIGIDNKIKIMQDVLFQHLGFANVDFYGRVHKVISKDEKGLAPQVYINNTERKGMFFLLTMTNTLQQTASALRLK